MIEEITQEGENDDIRESWAPEDILEEARVRITDKVEMRPALSMGYYNDSGETLPIPLISYGDFAIISGPSKSKKTFLKLSFVAAYLGGQAPAYWPTIKTHGSKGKLVIDFDTEQSAYHTTRMARNVHRLYGTTEEIENYICFKLRRYDPWQRMRFIDYIVFHSQFSANIGLIIIDGIADLVDNTNDIDQSVRANSLLLRITDEKQCALIGVIHKAHQVNKATGHLGSYVQKKAQTVFGIKMDPDNDTRIKVTPEYTRDFPFKAFEFGLNEDGLPADAEVLDDIFDDLK